MSAELLKRCVLFKDFTPIGIEILATIATPKIMLAGKPLFVEGSPAEALVIVVEGRIQIAMKSPDGRDMPIASLGAGEHLGEMALLAAGRHPMHLCSALAEVDSKILEITNSDFQAVMKEKPQACLKLLLAAVSEFARKSQEAREPLRHLLGRATLR